MLIERQKKRENNLASTNVAKSADTYFRHKEATGTQMGQNGPLAVISSVFFGMFVWWLNSLVESLSKFKQKLSALPDQLNAKHDVNCERVFKQSV